MKAHLKAMGITALLIAVIVLSIGFPNQMLPIVLIGAFYQLYMLLYEVYTIEQRYGKRDK
jgi:4-hydroxybenzoate polyprenyltransferase